MASAPERPGDQIAGRLRGAWSAKPRRSRADEQATPLELDVTLDGGAVFVAREGGPALLCVTGRFALPGLILHDMRVVLDDLRRGGPREVGRMRLVPIGPNQFGAPVGSDWHPAPAARRRKPRVRVRLAHGETRVLAEGDAGRERLLSLAGELVADYGGPGNARS